MVSAYPSRLIGHRCSVAQQDAADIAETSCIKAGNSGQCNSIAKQFFLIPIRNIVLSVMVKWLGKGLRWKSGPGGARSDGKPQRGSLYLLSTGTGTDLEM